MEEKQPLISPTTSAAAGTTMTSDSSNPGAGAGANHSTTASKGGGGGEAAAASEIPSVYTAPLGKMQTWKNFLGFSLANLSLFMTK